MTDPEGNQGFWGHLLDSIVVGPDRVVDQQGNWAAMSHTELYNGVHQNSDPQQAYDRAVEWEKLGNEITDHMDSLSSTVRKHTENWKGSSAESARFAIDELINWGNQAARTSVAMAKPVRKQAEIVATARAKMPEPVNVNYEQLAQPFGGGGIGDLAGGLTDMHAKVQQANAAHQRAVDVMSTMEESSKHVDSTVPQYIPPRPVVHKEARQAGTPLATQSAPPNTGPAAPTPQQHGGPAAPAAHQPPAGPGAEPNPNPNQATDPNPQPQQGSGPQGTTTTSGTPATGGAPPPGAPPAGPGPQQPNPASRPSFGGPGPMLPGPGGTRPSGGPRPGTPGNGPRPGSGPRPGYGPRPGEPGSGPRPGYGPRPGSGPRTGYGPRPDSSGTGPGTSETGPGSRGGASRPGGRPGAVPPGEEGARTANAPREGAARGGSAANGGAREALEPGQRTGARGGGVAEPGGQANSTQGGGSGKGTGAGAPGTGGARGERDAEHKRKGYLQEEDDVFAVPEADRLPPPVIGGTPKKKRPPAPNA
ncbi:PPE domain-containing protein [Sciscionella marina]|uniref:PPE domain-containing protein n=1 Tax=Sciscionella marina TaxID=508770 RepID=UPI0003800EC2|nr:PPE domain-containing protein [Sciscionella marina]